MGQANGKGYGYLFMLFLICYFIWRIELFKILYPRHAQIYTLIFYIHRGNVVVRHVACYLSRNRVKVRTETT
jgi:hypothetical protein